jgi:SH3-like domain-containing protein
MFKIILIFCILFNFNSFAKKGEVTGFELPRFVSLKSNEINLRIGPSINYPINIKYIKKNLPIEITDEFDLWRKVRDHEGNTGWIKKGLLKGDRYIITGIRNNDTKMFNRPNGKKIGVIKKNNILKLEMCLENWCYISHQKIKGWSSKNDIWGVYKTEVFKVKFYQPIINQYWKILDNKLFK